MKTNNELTYKEFKEKIEQLSEMQQELLDSEILWNGVEMEQFEELVSLAYKVSDDLGEEIHGKVKPYLDSPMTAEERIEEHKMEGLINNYIEEQKYK